MHARTVGAVATSARSPVATPSPRTRRDRAKEAVELLRLFRSEDVDPEPFYRLLSERAVRELPYPVAGARLLDLGAGAGELTLALRQAGAQAVAVEIDQTVLRSGTAPLTGAVLGDGTRLPFPDSSFDGIICSNVLEHTPSVPPVLQEIARVLRPGGWAWVSWTNWYSPWGGHEIVPFHYLGPRLGLRAWRRLFGEPRKNVPFVELWPTHIGDVLRDVAKEPSLLLRDAMPRYYPSQRWILRVPGLREVLTWNCLLLLERVPAPNGSVTDHRRR